MHALSENLRRLRTQRRWTQADLAARAGLPRATCADLERAGANPSLATLSAVAAALGTGIDELLRAGPARGWFKTVPAQHEEYRADGGRFQSRCISPITSRGVQIHRLVLLPDCRSVGRPHPDGAQEFFTCLEGTATVQIAEDAVEVEAGCLVQFPGHLRHVYINRGRTPAQAVSVVVMHLG